MVSGFPGRPDREDAPVQTPSGTRIAEQDEVSSVGGLGVVVPGVPNEDVLRAHPCDDTVFSGAVIRAVDHARSDVAACFVQGQKNSFRWAYLIEPWSHESVSQLS